MTKYVVIGYWENDVPFGIASIEAGDLTGQVSLWKDSWMVEDVEADRPKDAIEMGEERANTSV